MSIKIRGIDHVALNVQNLDRALEFYTKVLGLKISGREHQKPGAEYFLDCGPSLVGLIQGDEKGEKHFFKDGGVGADHFSFRVDAGDFDRIVQELQETGVPVRFSKKREKSWSVYFSDPDGNKIEMTAWPGEAQ